MPDAVTEKSARRRQRERHAAHRAGLELTWDDWSIVRTILASRTGDVVRDLAERGFKIAKLRDDDHAYVASLLKPGERFG